MKKRITRKEALARGSKRYFGKACAKHPDAERWVSSGGCVGCQRAYHKTPEARARKRVRQKTPEYLERHRVYLRARRKTPEYLARRKTPEARARHVARQHAYLKRLRARQTTP